MRYPNLFAAAVAASVMAAPLPAQTNPQPATPWDVQFTLSMAAYAYGLACVEGDESQCDLFAQTWAHGLHYASLIERCAAAGDRYDVSCHQRDVATQEVMIVFGPIPGLAELLQRTGMANANIGLVPQALRCREGMFSADPACREDATERHRIFMDLLREED